MTKKTTRKAVVGRRKELPAERPAWVAVANAVQLREIRLIDSFSHVRPEAIKGKRSYEIERSARVEISAESPLFMVFADFRLRGPSDTDPNKLALDIGASYLLVYKADGIRDFDRAALEEFADINALFNAWPYWREFVQSITTRMGLAPLTVPVLRIGTLAAERRPAQLPPAAAAPASSEGR